MGIVIGTLCFLAWQLVALLVRYQFLAWTQRPAPQPDLEPVSPTAPPP